MATEHKILRAPDVHLPRLRAELDAAAADGYAVAHFASHGDHVTVIMTRDNARALLEHAEAADETSRGDHLTKLRRPLGLGLLGRGTRGCQDPSAARWCSPAGTWHIDLTSKGA